MRAWGGGADFGLPSTLMFTRSSHRYGGPFFAKNAARRRDAAAAHALVRETNAGARPSFMTSPNEELARAPTFSSSRTQHDRHCTSAIIKPLVVACERKKTSEGAGL